MLSSVASCEELYDIYNAPVDKLLDYFGKVSRVDMNGNVIWYRELTIFDLQEVIQVGNYIYVVGSHAGARPLDKSGFLSYNPTATQPSNFFDLSVHSITTGANSHMYMAKLDLDGNVIWEKIYGYSDFSDPNDAWQNESTGKDLIFNSDGYIYAVGSAGQNSTANTNNFFVVKIDPLTGFLSAPAATPLNYKAILPIPTTLNSQNHSYIYMEARSICEIGTTGRMVLGGKGEFALGNPAVYEDWHRGIIYSIKQDLSLNMGFSPGEWPTNPRDFPASIGTDPTISSPNKTSNIWEVNYHTNKNEILVGLITNCDFCAYAGPNSATGQVLRLDANNGINSVVGINPSNLGLIKAYDLRIGMVETTDGGYAAVSSRRNVTALSPPTHLQLGADSLCTNITSPPVPYNSAYTNGPYGYWDTDPLIVKFAANGTKQWEWSEDVTPGRARQAPPADCKRQECMYKICQSQDGGYVISGNASFNKDDNYMVKLKSDCQATTVYDYSPNTNGLAFTVPNGQTVTWNSSKKINGRVDVFGTLIISGAGTTVEFADSAFTGIYSGIKVWPQGKLVVNNAVLTSLSSCPAPGMWNGIVLFSDILTSQSAQASAGHYLQPELQLSGATISNARHGIITGVENASSAGGIVNAFNSTFKNNYIDAEFIAYNPNVGLPANAPLISDKGKFYNCNFMADNFLNDPAFYSNGAKISNKIHVKLNGNRGIQITGCNFKTDVSGPLGTVNTDFRGAGIKAINSTFIVQDYCTLANSTGCVQFSGNAKFENLETGITAASSSAIQNYRVENVNFNNCYKGIYQNGVNYSIVQNNKFNVTAPILASANGCGSVINQRAIAATGNSGLCNPVQYYLLNSDGFKHANNLYNVTASGNTNVLGTLFNYCNGTSNYSYRNSYTSLLRGHQLQAGNNNLQLKCNTNATTKAYDVSVTSGAVSQQGACVSQNAPPNNLFSHLGTPQSDIKSATIFRYNFNGSPSGGTQIPFFFSTSIDNHNCGSGLNAFVYNNQTCPVEQNPGCGAACRTTQINNIQTQIDQDNALLLASAAATLITVINTQSPGQVKNALLAKSPYLSDAVLLAFLANNFPPGTVKNVVESNQPVTPPVWQAVVNAGLPNGIFNQLQSGQTGTSGRDQLQQTMQQLLLDKQNNINQAVALVLNPADTVNDYVQAETFLKMDNTGAYYDDLVSLYLTVGRLSDAQSYIGLLNKQPENKGLVDFYTLALQKSQQNTSWPSLLLLNGNADFITKLALNINTPGSAQAQVIRDVYLSDELFNFVEDFGNGSGARLVSNPASTDQPLMLKNNGITVYPNPFAEQLKISYNFEEGLAGGTIQLIEAGSGRVFFEGAFNGLNGEQVINTAQLNKGVYIIKIQQNQNKPVYFKLISTN